MKQKRPDYMRVELIIHAQQCFCVRNTRVRLKRSEPFVTYFHFVRLPTLNALMNLQDRARSSEPLVSLHATAISHESSLVDYSISAIIKLDGSTIVYNLILGK